MQVDENTEKGYKMMEQCQQSDSEEDVEQLGNNFISNLNNSSNHNKNSIYCLLKLKQINRQRDQAFKIVADQLQKSQMKLRKKKSIFIEEQLNKLKQKQKKHVYRGMDNNLLQQYRRNSQLDSIDQQIKVRQAKLIENYSSLSTYRSSLEKVANPLKSRKSTHNYSTLPSTYIPIT